MGAPCCGASQGAAYEPNEGIQLGQLALSARIDKCFQARAIPEATARTPTETGDSVVAPKGERVLLDFIKRLLRD
jgi:hypothetical protein